MFNCIYLLINHSFIITDILFVWFWFDFTVVHVRNKDYNSNTKKLVESQKLCFPATFRSNPTVVRRERVFTQDGHDDVVLQDLDGTP